jgi:hypothetical protein
LLILTPHLFNVLNLIAFLFCLAASSVNGLTNPVNMSYTQQQKNSYKKKSFVLHLTLCEPGAKVE